ncbi:uncharacterized protein JCM15063_005726 [Sporobolomyces koalae]|uniref:uncharacterized protein n=1 Tax=Sporobolomyces koalae TaxID=500713 RepID=UPI00316CDE4C
MSSKDKRRAHVRHSAIPFPRPLGTAPRPSHSHRRTQSSLASPTTERVTSDVHQPHQHHHRSKSWLNSLFRPTSTNAAFDPDGEPSSTRRRDLVGSFRGLTSRTKARPNLGAVVAIDDFAKFRHASAPAERALPDVHDDLPEPPLEARESAELARRLASWDWARDEQLEPDLPDKSTDTLEIKQHDHSGDEGCDGPGAGGTDELSLGTVWKGFLADLGPATSSPPGRALSPTATSPPLPPIPLPEDYDEDGPDNEISFLSLAADSSFAHSLNLSSFPSPSGGEITFTDPFRFANHLSQPTPPAAIPSLTSLSRASSPTLAERRSRPVPSLRINPHYGLLRKPSCAPSAVSESIYSRYEEDADNHGDEPLHPQLESYFSPISPEQSSPFFTNQLAVSASGSVLPPPLSGLGLVSYTMDANEGISNQSHSSTSTTFSSNARSSRAHSPLFEPSSILPPSSTFENDAFESLPVAWQDDKEEEPVADHQSVTGWREDWTLQLPENPAEAVQAESEGYNEAEEEEEGSEEYISEGEIEKRISIHGQRELERRAMERKLRWVEERNTLYGEPIDAEVRFGCAL